MIDQPSIAILIDCWDLGYSPPNNKLFENILEFVENPNIHTIVLASYNAKPEHLNSNTIWYRNYNELFYDKQPLRKIQDLFNVHKLYTNIRKIETTDPKILNYKSPSKFQISMHWTWQLEYYLSLNPEIKNVYVLGASWEECVKMRPLGYEQLREINGINILINPNNILTMSAKHPNLNNNGNWKHIENNIWKYTA
jgi:hypothetical protein